MVVLDARPGCLRRWPPTQPAAPRPGPSAGGTGSVSAPDRPGPPPATTHGSPPAQTHNPTALPHRAAHRLRPRPQPGPDVEGLVTAGNGPPVGCNGHDRLPRHHHCRPPGRCGQRPPRPLATSKRPSRRPARPGGGPGPPGRSSRPSGHAARGHGRHLRDQAAVALQGRPRPGLDPAAVAADYEAGGRVLPVGAHRRGVLRREPGRPRRGPGRLLPAGPAQGLHRQSPLDVCDARIMGADAVLLIVAALDDDELAVVPGPGRDGSRWPPSSRSTTRRSSTGPWPPAPTWSGSTSGTCAPSRSTASRALRMGERIPAEVVAVAESGIRDAADVAAPGRRRLPGRPGGGDAGPVGRPRPPPSTGLLGARPMTRLGVGRRRSATSCSSRSAAITSEADALLAVGMGAVGGGLRLRPLAPPDGGRRRWPTSSSACPTRPSPSGSSGTSRPAGWSRSPATSACGPCSCTASSRPRTPGGWPSGCRWTIKAFPAGHREHRALRRVRRPARCMIDGPNPGSGELFDWRLAEGVVDPGRLIVSGGLRPDNVAAAVAHLHPWGVDVATGVESSPGREGPRQAARLHRRPPARPVGRWRPSTPCRRSGDDRGAGHGPVRLAGRRRPAPADGAPAGPTAQHRGTPRHARLADDDH